MIDKELDKKVNSVAVGLLIAIGLPALGLVFGGWKWALFWFVVPQIILGILHLIEVPEDFKNE